MRGVFAAQGAAVFLRRAAFLGTRLSTRQKPVPESYVPGWMKTFIVTVVPLPSTVSIFISSV